MIETFLFIQRFVLFKLFIRKNNIKMYLDDCYEKNTDMNACRNKSQRNISSIFLLIRSLICCTMQIMLHNTLHFCDVLLLYSTITSSVDFKET